MFSIEDLWYQAKNIRSAIYMDNSKTNKAIIHKGVKIEKDRDKYFILRCHRENYQEIMDEEYQIFYEEGWVVGRINVLMNDLEYKLDKLFIRTRNAYQDGNTRQVRHYKNQKENVLSKYSKLNKQLNQIKNEKHI